MYLRTTHVVIGLVLFAALWFFWPHAAQNDAAKIDNTGVASDPLRSIAPVSAAPQQTNPAEDREQKLTEAQPLELLPMPVPALPFAQARAALEQRAQAGDLPAAMRLLDESKCCGTVHVGMNYLLRIRPPAMSAEETKIFDELLTRIKSHEQTMQLRCGDLKKNPLNYQAIQKWARAAGDPLSVIEFTRARPNYGASIQEQIKQLQERERDAIPSLHRLVAQGNLDAVMMLASLHATPGYHGDLGSLVKQDWETTAVYNLLYLRAGGRAFRTRVQSFAAQMSTRLTPEQLQAAKTRAADIYDASFAGRTASEYGVPMVAPGLRQEADFAATPRASGASACPALPGPQSQAQRDTITRILARMNPSTASSAAPTANTPAPVLTPNAAPPVVEAVAPPRQ
jgi:hypothetical protein